jgi:hypothetical protein
MTEHPDIRTVRRRAYLTAHEDGLMDIGLGLVFLLFGVLQAAGMSRFNGVCWMPALFIAPAKRILTEPRIGTARFGRSRGVLALKIGLILLALGLVGFIVAASFLHSAALDAWTKRYFAPAFGLSLALFPLAGAIALGVRRFYAYAILVTAGFSLLSFRRESLAAVFLVIGMVLTVMGILVLIRFLRGHPVSPGEAGTLSGPGVDCHG